MLTPFCGDLQAEVVILCWHHDTLLAPWYFVGPMHSAQYDLISVQPGLNTTLTRRYCPIFFPNWLFRRNLIFDYLQLRLADGSIWAFRWNVMSWSIKFQLVKIIACVEKAPRPSINNVFWILSSDTICQLDQLFSNIEAAMLSKHVHKGTRKETHEIQEVTQNISLNW